MFFNIFILGQLLAIKFFLKIRLYRFITFYLFLITLPFQRKIKKNKKVCICISMYVCIYLFYFELCQIK